LVILDLNFLIQDGTFLVRKSKQGGDTQPYTLAVLYEGHVYNLKMRVRPDGQVALGEEKPDELVSELLLFINRKKKLFLRTALLVEQNLYIKIDGTLIK
jgi:hypothetical protein